MDKIVACIMAGGVGSRFWPASTEDHPKQFLDILGLGQSLIQLTYDRYRKMGLAADHIWVITNKQYVDLVADHLPELPRNRIIGEPERKNTAPSAYLGSKLALEAAGDSIVIMAPSDHHIEDDQRFFEVIALGRQFLQNHDALVTIGIQPSFPNTGYGYIAYDQSTTSPHKVASFTEKPNLQKATAFLEHGGYLWNAGIFMWRTSTLINAFEKHAPSIKETIDLHFKTRDGQLDTDLMAKGFSLLEDASIDYEIMERATNVYTIPSEFKWSDLGSWKSLYDKSAKDENKNVGADKNTLVIDAKRNLIFAPGKRVVINGLQDFMIIEDKDTLVISPIAADQDVKKWRNHFDEK